MVFHHCIFRDLKSRLLQANAIAQLKIIGVSRDPEHSDITEEGFALRVMINEHILGNNVAGI